MNEKNGARQVTLVVVGFKIFRENRRSRSCRLTGSVSEKLKETERANEVFDAWIT